MPHIRRENFGISNISTFEPATLPHISQVVRDDYRKGLAQREKPRDLQLARDYKVRSIVNRLSTKNYAQEVLATMDGSQREKGRFIPGLSANLVTITLLPLSLEDRTPLEGESLDVHMDEDGGLHRRGSFLTRLFNPTIGYVFGENHYHDYNGSLPYRGDRPLERVESLL